MNRIFKNTVCFLAAILTISLHTSCEKFLDVKSSKSLVIPNRLEDLQALLDNASFINYGYYPGLLEMGADDYQLPYSILNSLPDFEQGVYRWESEPYYVQGNINSFWSFCYRPVLIVNTVLDELPAMEGADTQRGKEIKGAALFLRAFSFFHLAQIYCAPYDIGGDNQGLGIPLRLSPDFNSKSVRSTVQETYDRILLDLHEALDLLPNNSDYQTRPTKTAAYALLARVYLSMEEYDKAETCADEALKRYNVLMDYNTMDLSIAIPFAVMNEETIFYAYSFGNQMLNPSRANVNLDLYNTYAEHDLRKTGYFTKKGEAAIAFKGAKHGRVNSDFFIGLATDELFLIRAECAARAGETVDAMNDLNHLLRHRWEAEAFEELTASDAEEALSIILLERRKELLMRGIRWSDLRRLNKDPRFAMTLIRKVDDGTQVHTYTLPPNDLRYVYQIPQEVILKTGMQQNPR